MRLLQSNSNPSEIANQSIKDKISFAILSSIGSRNKSKFTEFILEKRRATKKGDFVGMYKEQKVRINSLIVKGLEHNLLSVKKLVQIIIR